MQGLRTKENEKFNTFFEAVQDAAKKEKNIFFRCRRMEGFWGIIKRERYYGKRFTDRESLIEMIEEYISYYNNKRLQRNLGVLTPMEKHETYLQAA